MNKTRIISRIDIKNDHVIKGIHLEGLRKVGKPNDLAFKYYSEGIDEIVFMDAVAAYYDRNSLSHIVEQVCQNVFVPLTVGGGIRTLEDIKKALDSGADKVAINTQCIKDPAFITEASKVFGSQCIVVSIEAKKLRDNEWEAYIDNGREPTGLNVIDWAKKVESLGAGEIMVTSIDMEGTKKGFDTQLSAQIADAVGIPVIVSGGAGKIEDISGLFEHADVDAVALASVLHYNILDIAPIKQHLVNSNVKVRI